MIHINDKGIGYMKGDKAKVVRHLECDDLIEFQYLEGIHKGIKFVQPKESVKNSEYNMIK